MSGCRHGGRDVYERPRRRWTPTSISYKAPDGDLSMLREVYIGDIRFVRAEEKDYDDVENEAYE